MNKLSIERDGNVISTKVYSYKPTIHDLSQDLFNKHFGNLSPNEVELCMKVLYNEFALINETDLAWLD